MTATTSSGVRMHRLASSVLLAPLVVIGVVSGYLTLLTAAAWRSHLRGARTPRSHGDARHRFLVLVPAHDEERLLPATLRSLAALDYPRTHVAVHVVADNCADRTAEVARELGAQAHERTAPDEPGKGPALTWLLRRLWERGEPHDAVVIVDADTLVAPDFLRAMDARLATGERVLQGYYSVRDPDASWAVSLRYAALAARHYLRPLARTSIGGSAGLYGNGMVFAADVLRDHGWSSHLTEDIELEARLLLHGERVGFAPDARIEAEMPRRLADARTQNQRWERGRVEVARRYVPTLAREAVRRRGAARLRCADAAIDQLVPPLSVVVAATMVAAVSSVSLWRLLPSRLARTNVGLAVGALGAQSAYVASGLRMVDAPPAVWRALGRAPVYTAWKLGLWLRAATAGGGAGPWIRTRRNP